jgi:hypothetical protein
VLRMYWLSNVRIRGYIGWNPNTYKVRLQFCVCVCVCVCGQHHIIRPWYWSWRASVSQAARRETQYFSRSSCSPTRSSIPWCLQNLKIHYMFTLHQANQIQLAPSYVISLRNLNAILQFYTWSTKWPLPSMFSGENLL